jgi:hypothetical protein
MKMNDLEGEKEILCWKMPQEELRQILAELKIASLSGGRTTKKVHTTERLCFSQGGASGRFCSGRRQGQSYGGEVIYR